MAHLGKIGTNWSFLAIAPNILSMSDATLQSPRIGVLEVLEENIGIGDVVDCSLCVGRWGNVIKSDQPLLEIEEGQNYPAIRVAKMGQVRQGD